MGYVKPLLPNRRQSARQMRQNSHPRHVWRPLASKLQLVSPVFILPLCTGNVALVLHKILDNLTCQFFAYVDYVLPGDVKCPFLRF